MERVLLLGNNTSIKSASEVLSLFNNLQLKRPQLLYLTVYIFETGDDDDDDDFFLIHQSRLGITCRLTPGSYGGRPSAHLT